MKKTIRTALAGLLLVPALALGVSAVATTTDTFAQSLSEGVEATKTTDNDTDLDSVVQTIVNVLLFIIGIISVIMIIIGGIRYAVSGGDSGAVTSAKNTILYAIVGLVIAVFAYAIVNWVLGEIIA